MYSLNQITAQVEKAIAQATTSLAAACDANASTKVVASKLATIAKLRAMKKALTA